MQIQKQPTESAPAPGLEDSDADIEEGGFVIPPSLRDEPVFFVFSFRDRDGKLTKVPCDAGSVKARSVNGYEPPTTVTFEEAYNVVKESRQRYSGRNQLDGIMLSLAESGLLCLDLDDVLNPETGEADEFATSLVEDAGSFATVSSSSTGLHIFLDEDKGLDPDYKTVGKLELYDERGIAVTFRHVSGTPTEIAETSGLARTLQREHNERKASSTSDSTDESVEVDTDFDVDATTELSEKQTQLIESMTEWDDRAELLWERGNSEWHHWDTRSDADWALAKKLSWWADFSRCLKPFDYSDEELTGVFLASDLARRSKCQDRPHYAIRTVAKARAEVRAEN